MLNRSISLVLLAGLLALPASAANNPPVGAAELADQLGEPGAPLILDVRSVREYESGHVPGALNIPHGQLPDRLSELGAGKDREIVVYCEVGGRAEVATNVLESAGFTQVRNLEGHMRNWRAGDFPQE